MNVKGSLWRSACARLFGLGRHRLAQHAPQDLADGDLGQWLGAELEIFGSL